MGNSGYPGIYLGEEFDGSYSLYIFFILDAEGTKDSVWITVKKRQWYNIRIDSVFERSMVKTQQ